jgi:hypothetical protein
MPPSDDDDLGELARNTLLEDDDGEVYRRKKGPELRLVSSTDKPRPKAKPPHLQRNDGLFGNAPRSWLLAADCPLPPRWRLYFLLQIGSVQGTRQADATNKLARSIGLTNRSSKMRQLRILEKLGLVTVARDGRKEPSVTLCPIPGWPPPRPK